MPAADTELIIEAGRTERNYWRDLFRYRELFYFLVWRDVLVRYKQTVIGVLWAVLRPFLTMVVFVFVFSRIAKLPSDGVPYSVMVFAAMLPWQLFATSLTEAAIPSFRMPTSFQKFIFRVWLCPRARWLFHLSILQSRARSSR